MFLNYQKRYKLIDLQRKRFVNRMTDQSESRRKMAGCLAKGIPTRSVG